MVVFLFFFFPIAVFETKGVLLKGFLHKVYDNTVRVSTVHKGVNQHGKA